MNLTSITSSKITIVTMQKPRSHKAAFTLIELLISMSVLTLLMVALFDMMRHTQDSVTRQQAKSEEFREARAALENISRNLSGAVMNAYWAYGDYSAANKVNYTRQSDSHFVSAPVVTLLGSRVQISHGQSMFFQTSTGTANPQNSADPNPSVVGMPFNLVTCLGYYVDYNSDLPERPDFISGDTPANPERKRFRLMEFTLPADKNILYSPTINLNSLTSQPQSFQWFQGPYAGGGGTMNDYAVPLADNILALVLVPRYISVKLTARNESQGSTSENSSTTTKAADDYVYDSREKQWGSNSEKAIASHHQLPPVIQVSLIAAEERSYDELVGKKGDQALQSEIASVFSGKLTNYNRHAEDMLDIEEALTNLGLKHRVFTTNVTLRGSKWIVEEKITP